MPAPSYLNVDMLALRRVAAQAGVPLNPESGTDPDPLPDADINLTGMEVQRGPDRGRVIDGDLIERAARSNYGTGTEREERLVLGRGQGDGLRLCIPTGVPADVSAPASRIRTVQIVFVVRRLAGAEESPRQRCANLRCARQLTVSVRLAERSSKPVRSRAEIALRRLNAIVARRQRSADRGRLPPWCANSRGQRLTVFARQDEKRRSLVGAQFEIQPCRRRQRERVEVDPETDAGPFAETITPRPAPGDIHAAAVGVPCGPGTVIALCAYPCRCAQCCSERQERHRAGDDRRSLYPLHHRSSFHDLPLVLHAGGKLVPAGCPVLVGRCGDLVTAERERSGDSDRAVAAARLDHAVEKPERGRARINLAGEECGIG